MRSALWGLYQLATAAALLVAGPFFLARRGSHYLPTLQGRLGREPGGRGARGALWLHAVSVGEVGVAATLAKALPADLPLLVTTVTPTGQERARAAFAGRAEVAYLPFDLGFAVQRFFRRYEPSALILVEGDYWPLLLREARRRGLPVAVVNGRVGDRSFRRMRRLRAFLGPLFGAVSRFGVQTAGDRDRLVELGIDAGRIAVTGNLKYESPEPPAKPELEAAVREAAAGRPLLVAGSTMAGEEAAVLDAFLEAGGGQSALLVLAPRHPERWTEVDALLQARNAGHVRRSALGGGPARPSIILLDSLGELAGLYRLAAAAFIGGTLVPTGGHNPLEAARFGVPVAVGPAMHNFREMAEAFDAAGAWRRVKDSRELAAVWREWLADPAAARETGDRGLRLVEENRGALARTMEMLGTVISALPASPAQDPSPWSPLPPHSPRPGEGNPVGAILPFSLFSRRMGGRLGEEGRGDEGLGWGRSESAKSATLPPNPSSPWQLLYGGIHRLRRRWYRQRAHRLPRPVISVGNLHWGGSGKTPLVAAIAAHLRDRGLAVCILTRGYGSRGRGVRVVSAGQGPLLDARTAGDEPALLAAELPGVAVVVGPDRYTAGLEALRRLDPAPDLFLLDDGFSHLALARDLDLVVFPASDPFGGGRLFPSGRLREPLAAISRAHAAILTGAADWDGRGDALGSALRSRGFAGPGFASVTRPGVPRLASGDPLPAGARVLLVTAIARPGAFADLARSLGLEIAGTLSFRDHYRYPASSLARIAAAFRSSGIRSDTGAVLVTSKDRVKLLGRLKVPLAELPIRADPEPAFWEWLDGEWERLR
ncbi:MAG: tetraacyldisaccharide 4'-kinase [Thermoanaerobaculia bacterium]